MSESTLPIAAIVHPLCYWWRQLLEKNSIYLQSSPIGLSQSIFLEVLLHNFAPMRMRSCLGHLTPLSFLLPSSNGFNSEHFITNHFPHTSSSQGLSLENSSKTRYFLDPILTHQYSINEIFSPSFRYFIVSTEELGYLYVFGNL
jgi:hypothetical protein